MIKRGLLIFVGLCVLGMNVMDIHPQGLHSAKSAQQEGKSFQEKWACQNKEVGELCALTLQTARGPGMFYGVCDGDKLCKIPGEKCNARERGSRIVYVKGKAVRKGVIGKGGTVVCQPTS